MICIYADSHLCTLTMIFCTCIWIPLLQIIQIFLRIFSFVVNPHDQKAQPEETLACVLDLRVSRFQELVVSSKNRGEVVNDKEERCSICLMQFEEEDLVNKLPRCGHVFHMECMEKWLQRCQFTCPLCRSLVLHVGSSPCKMRAPGICILPTAQDS